MALFSIGICLWIAATLAVINGLPDGAPHSACGTQMPNHINIMAQPAPIPYAITITGGGTTYSNDQQIKVKVTGTGDFKGLFIQARKTGNNDDVVGTFEDPGPPSGDKLKFRPCPDMNGPKNGVTHTNTSINVMQPGSIELTWNAPNSDVGNIAFVATVAQGRSKYWLDVKSLDLTYVPPPATTPSPSVAVSKTPVHGVMLMLLGLLWMLI